MAVTMVTFAGDDGDDEGGGDGDGGGGYCGDSDGGDNGDDDQLGALPTQAPEHVKQKGIECNFNKKVESRSTQ